MKNLTFLFLSFCLLSQAQDYNLSDAIPVLSENTSGVRFPRIAINGDNQPVIVYGKTDGKLYATIKNGSDFSEPINITGTGPAHGSSTNYGADIAVSGDNLYVSYQANDGIYLITSIDNGQTWNAPFEPIDFPDHHVEFSKIGVGANGYPRIVSIKSNLNWTSPEQIVIYTNDGVNYEYSVANDHLNNIVCECCQGEFVADSDQEVVLYRDNAQDIRDIEIAISNDASANFDQQTMIDFSNWYIPSCPVSGPEAYISSNRLHAVWMSRGSGSTRAVAGTYDLANDSVGENHFVDDNVGASVTQNFPQIAGNDEFSAVIWEDNRFTFKNIMLAYSTDGLNSFGSSIVLSDTSTNGHATSPAITIDNNEKIHIIYVEDNNIRYHLGSFSTGAAELAEPIKLQQISLNEYLIPHQNELIGVFNHLGQQVKLGAANTKTINLNHLESGIYYIHLNAENQTQIAKVFVQ